MVTMVVVYQSDRNQVAYAVLTPPAFSETLTGITYVCENICRKEELNMPFVPLSAASQLVHVNKVN